MRIALAAATASLALLGACSQSDTATAPRRPLTDDITPPHPNRMALPINAAQREAAARDQARLTVAPPPPTHAQPTAAERAPDKATALHRLHPDEIDPPRPNAAPRRPNTDDVEPPRPGTPNHP
jgi:hypothetical protein